MKGILAAAGLVVALATGASAAAQDVVVKDVLPAGVTLVSVTASEPAPWSLADAETDLGVSDQVTTTTLSDGRDASGQDTTSFAGRQEVSVVLGGLSSALYSTADQTTATVTMVARADIAGTAVNDAMVSAANPDQNESDNYATVTSTVS